MIRARCVPRAPRRTCACQRQADVRPSLITVWRLRLRPDVRVDKNLATQQPCITFSQH
jgi:hypothetical protein